MNIAAGTAVAFHECPRTSPRPQLKKSPETAEHLNWPGLLPELARFKSGPFPPPFKYEGEVVASWSEAQLIRYLDVAEHGITSSTGYRNSFMVVMEVTLLRNKFQRRCGEGSLAPGFMLSVGFPRQSNAPSSSLRSVSAVTRK